MADEQKVGSKGTFSKARLSVSAKYLVPARRTQLLMIGALGFLGLVAVASFDFLSSEPRLLSNGPLSSNHASYDQNCSACHASPGKVTDEACSSCHEQFGDPIGVFSFDSHYLYRSDDFQRIVPSEHETPCFSCHIEHEGRAAEITQVADRQCLDCHDFGAFDADHPEFDFAASRSPAEGGLKFAHTHHVKELLSKRGWQDVEKACASCHEPEPDGVQFQSLDFDTHCGECHLPATLRTDPLPIRSARRDAVTGVETLSEIQSGGEAGARWSYFLNPAEFREAGGRLIKSPLYHRDPWVLHNLRKLRRQLFPSAGLADLLVGTADVPPAELEALYHEAVGTLRGYALELRSRPEREVQDDLKRISSLLDQLERRLADPYAPLDESKFVLALGPPATLTDEVRAEIESVVETLTKECQECHELENATIVRVQELQSLHRAEFNHRPHTLQRRCLDCHQEIPIQEGLQGDAAVDAALDNAGIHNVPQIGLCQDCHNAKQVASTCVTCHQFHPSKNQGSTHALYPEEANEDEEDR